MVAINGFSSDTPAEIAYIKELCASLGVKAVVSEAFSKGGEGATELAREVCRLCGEKSDFRPLYDDGLPIKEKIETVARRIYRASGVDFAPAALKSVKEAEENGYGALPVCIAKTQYSLSDDPSKLRLPVRAQDIDTRGKGIRRRGLCRGACGSDNDHARAARRAGLRLI